MSLFFSEINTARPTKLGLFLNYLLCYPDGATLPSVLSLKLPFIVVLLLLAVSRGVQTLIIHIEGQERK